MNIFLHKVAKDAGDDKLIVTFLSMAGVFDRVLS